MRHNYWAPSLKPVSHRQPRAPRCIAREATENRSLSTATRESLLAATKTQHSQKYIIKNKSIIFFKKSHLHLCYSICIYALLHSFLCISLLFNVRTWYLPWEVNDNLPFLLHFQDTNTDIVIRGTNMKYPNRCFGDKDVLKTALDLKMIPA